MRLHDFTKPELDMLIAECNFTDDELFVFCRKAKGRTVIQICFDFEEMGRPCSESTVNRLSASVTNKALRVLRMDGIMEKYHLK